VSVAEYATAEGLRARIFGSADVPTEVEDLLEEVAAEVNDFVEHTTERVIGPVPTWSDSSVSGTAGGRTLTGVTITGLNPGDRLLVGLLSGTHEAVTVVSAVTNTVNLRRDLENSYTNAPAQRIAVLDGATALGKVLRYTPGIVALAAVEFSDGTQPEEWRLDPVTPPPGLPHSSVRLLNGTSWPTGRDDVRLIGPGPCVGLTDATAFGFPAIPDRVRTIAYNLAAGRWQMKATGGTYEIAPGTDDVQVGEFLLSRTDWHTLRGLKKRWALA
jgi:hypothetical protein